MPQSKSPKNATHKNTKNAKATKAPKTKTAKPQKHILVFGLTEIKGGVESVIMNYYRNIDRKKVRFSFLCNTKVVAYQDEIIENGDKIYRIPARSRDLPKYRKAMKHFFEKHADEFDAIWVNVCSLANIDYLVAAKKYGIPQRIIHSHNSENMDSKFRGLLHQANRRRIERYATDFWSCSEKASDWFYTTEVQSRHEIHIVENAIDLNKYKFNKLSRKRFRREYNFENDFIIGNVGRLHFQKNQSFSLKIFAEILKARPDAQLIFVGQGPDASALKEQAAALNITANTHFLGQIDDVPAALSAFDIFLFPSVFEGLGLACIEAESNGLPTFASKGCMPDKVNISPYFNFISLDDSPKTWAKAILDFDLKNVDRANPKIYESAIANNFSIQTEAKKLETLFKRRA